ncbi:sialate O-acetylesterase [Dyadobacter tibetensis]|uniref:sialate O-acetylesterase n=1 Tax=Dyadobacter tibetensis TaxID=1211851 RepID=UPI000471108B|nr:sialate O-acetylesterase [Dyadobacter tibetensis]
MPAHRSSKIHLGLLSLLLSFHQLAFSQNIGSFHFSALPENMQLFAREANNEALVTIAGRNTDPEYKAVSVITLRQNSRIGYSSQPLNYTTGNEASFEIKTKIKAELAEYSVAIYGKKSNNDSSLIARRDRLVAGDFYIIYGQSNAVAWEVDYTYRHPYARTMGFAANVGRAWGLSNDLGPRVGIFGIEFQKHIADQYQIPTCVINAALAGASIEQLTVRNEQNHSDPSTAYGGLLNYARETGLLPHLRGIFYWQGESEASSENPLSWAPSFDRLAKQMLEDYSMVEKIYVFQLPLFGGGAYDDRIGELREAQRTLNRKYPTIQPYAPLGAPGWNGFHYGLEGYLKIGEELAAMAGHFHYGKTKKVTSPSLQKAYYSTPSKDEVTLVFEDYQQMVYPGDTLVTNIESSQEPQSIYAVKDFFYLNKTWRKTQAGRAESNRIILKLKEAGQDSLVKYLPSKYHHAGLSTAPWVYLGPFLRNKEGFRAFAFHHTTIHPYEDLGTLKLAISEPGEEVTINWSAAPDVKGYQLDIYYTMAGDTIHRAIQLAADQTSYVDAEALQGISAIYGIRAIRERVESTITYASHVKKSVDKLVTGIPTRDIEIVVYPNPVDGIAHIRSELVPIHRIQYLSPQGSLLEEHQYPGQHRVELDLRNHPNGRYLLRIFTDEGISVHPVLLLNP